MKLWIEKIHLDLKVNWKLSRNQTTFKENFIVHLDTPVGHFRSEIAPNIRYGETIENISTEFDLFKESLNLDRINSIEALKDSLQGVKLHALRFGLETVFLSYLAKKEG